MVSSAVFITEGCHRVGYFAHGNNQKDLMHYDLMLPLYTLIMNRVQVGDGVL